MVLQNFYENLSRSPHLVKIGPKIVHFTRRGVFHTVGRDLCDATITANAFLCFHGNAFNTCYATDSDVSTSTIQTECTVTFPWQQCLRKPATLHYRCIACFVFLLVSMKTNAPPVPYPVPVQGQKLQTGVKCTPTKTIFVFN
jgi:hypothetical protein